MAVADLVFSAAPLSFAPPASFSPRPVFAGPVVVGFFAAAVAVAAVAVAAAFLAFLVASRKGSFAVILLHSSSSHLDVPASAWPFAVVAGRASVDIVASCEVGYPSACFRLDEVVEGTGASSERIERS